MLNRFIGMRNNGPTGELDTGRSSQEGNNVFIGSQPGVENIAVTAANDVT